jgi:hypothetical protein
MSELAEFLILEEGEAHPTPLVTSRDPWPSSVAVPRSVAGLVKLAEGEGWEAIPTYSQGYVSTTGKGKVKLVHTIVVRMTRTVGDVIRRGIVYYEAKPALKLEWKAVSAMVMGQDHWPYQEGIGVTAMAEWVQESAGWTGQEVANWAGALKAKALQAKADAAQKAKERPKKAKVTA